MAFGQLTNPIRAIPTVEEIDRGSLRLGKFRRLPAGRLAIERDIEDE